MGVVDNTIFKNITKAIVKKEVGYATKGMISGLIIGNTKSTLAMILPEITITNEEVREFKNAVMYAARQGR